MRERSSRASSFTVDVVLVTAMRNELAVLLTRSAGDRERWSLPWRFAQSGESFDAAAAKSGEEALGEQPSWIEQIAAFGDGRRHPSDTEVSVAFVGLVPHETASPRTGYTWFPMSDLPPISPRQRAMVEAATRVMQSRLRSEERRVGKECRARWAPEQ